MTDHMQADDSGDESKRDDPFRLTIEFSQSDTKIGSFDSADVSGAFETYNGPCPYIPFGVWITRTRHYDDMAPEEYERLLNKGVRRSGHYFYQNRCPGCSECRLIKIDVRRFEPSRSQRRAMKKNRDIVIRRRSAGFDQEEFELYQKYCMDRHDHFPDEIDYSQFLIESPVDTEIMSYYLEDRLVGLGWIDILVKSISSVYFAFDPEYESRSLGVFSMIKEIELCREMNKDWLHAGFWVKSSPKMAYKANYRPCFILNGETWREL